ncbi:MAG: TlyA family RNA methyltransferase [Chloroflexi bacterium]|nr:TlyA family RNA methyltransferase [Chloroflexota bacterium]
MTEKNPLDALLVERGLAKTPTHARALIMTGAVRVNGQVRTKPGMPCPVEAKIEVREPSPFAGRGGQKLLGALERLDLDVTGFVCADVGASTGGFTDCLLQRGAARVYAIDVGYGQLAWKLRQDPRVVVMERTNVRHLDSLPEAIDLVTVDVSFISLTRVLPVLRGYLRPTGAVVALVKPQFEAARSQVEKGGVVRDSNVHRAVLRNICRWAVAQGWVVAGLVPSPLRGPAGNIEFFLHLAVQGQPVADLDHLIETCLV